MKLTSLKSLKLARPRLGQVLMPLAAITLGQRRLAGLGELPLPAMPQLRSMCRARRIRQ
jgi:hypothetical protein